MNRYLALAIIGFLAAGGNILGGCIIARKPALDGKFLRWLTATGAGFLLAVVILEVVPESSRQWSGAIEPAMIWLLFGYLLLHLAEHTIAPHFHFGEETHHEEMHERGVALKAVLGLSIHAFFDGVVMAAGLLTNHRLGLTLFLAVVLHKIPEGFTIASIMISAGRNRRGAWQATLVIAGATIAGVLSVAAVEPVIKYALPLSAGVTLYVATSDLIPEVNREYEFDRGRNGLPATIFVFGGVFLFYLTHLALTAALGQN
ncbi:MAG: ZIP family magnesium transporter [Acidobacteria bacterium]|nr:ZIP family magnesium transporter [Acidobacteriota bacterium]